MFEAFTICDIKNHELLKMVLIKTISQMCVLYMGPKILFPILPILCEIAQSITFIIQTDCAISHNMDRIGKKFRTICTITTFVI